MMKAATIGLAVLGGATALYIAVATGLYFGQRKLLYIPDSEIPDPARAGVPEMQRVVLSTEDGLQLVAWWRPAEPGRATIVYFHGNAGHIGHRGFKFRPYLEAGLGVLAVEYRGYGGNPGRPNEEGLYRDGRAALVWLDGRGIDSGSRVLYGESLGTGVAVQLATESGGAAVVLESPYTSIADVAAQHYRWLPAHPLIRDRYESLAKIAGIEAPLLILHGERDRVVPAAHGRALLSAAHEPKQAVFFPDAAHEDIYDHGGATAVLRFLSDIGLA